MPSGQKWRVVGDGGGKGGILAREGQGLATPELAGRLGTGAIVEELELAGGRLHYALVSGSGPASGWVSLAMKGKDLVVREETESQAASGGTSGLREVAEGVWEFVLAQSEECHAKVFPFVASGCRKAELKAKAEDCEARYKAGKLGPCVYKRRMTLVRSKAARGGVVVYSPVECLEELQQAVRSLGGCAGIVLPNAEHAIHGEAWAKAFPDAAIVAPGGDAMAPFLAAMPELQMCRPGERLPAAAFKALDPQDFNVEVVNTGGWEEVCLFHRSSKTFLAGDFIYFGSHDKTDPEGWKMLGSDEWRELYTKAFCTSEKILLPAYRMFLKPDQQKLVAASLKKILAWQPERVMSAHCGKIPEGREAAAKVLEGSWGWCKA